MYIIFGFRPKLSQVTMAQPTTGPKRHSATPENLQKNNYARDRNSLVYSMVPTRELVKLE